MERAGLGGPVAVTGKRTRLLALGLFISLLLNVFLASVLVAYLLTPAEPQRTSNRYSFIDDWHAMAETLPEPQRAVAVEKWQHQREVWERSRALSTEARQAANAALAAETFVADAMREAFTRMRTSSNDRWNAFQEAVLVTAPYLTLEQRQSYAAASEKRLAEREAAKAGR